MLYEAVFKMLPRNEERLRRRIPMIWLCRRGTEIISNVFTFQVLFPPRQTKIQCISKLFSAHWPSHAFFAVWGATHDETQLFKAERFSLKSRKSTTGWRFISPLQNSKICWLCFLTIIPFLSRRGKKYKYSSLTRIQFSSHFFYFSPRDIPRESLRLTY